MKMTKVQVDNVNTLAKNGWRLSNSYNDGTLRMAKNTMIGSSQEQEVGIFLRRDGAISLPHTPQTRLAQTELHELGFKFKHGKEPSDQLHVPFIPEQADDREVEGWCAYLTETLVPDLRESGYEATADDFELCVRLIHELVFQRDEAEREKETIISGVADGES